MREEPVKKSVLGNYFQKSEFEGHMCDSPEEIAETLRINEEMKVVQRKFRSMSAQSRIKAQGFRFTR